jgi:hypothetical protein
MNCSPIGHSSRLSIGGAVALFRQDKPPPPARPRAIVVIPLERALSAGVAVRADIQSALGCGFEGEIDRDPATSTASKTNEFAPANPHPAAFSRYPLPLRGRGERDPFSRSREKVAA